MDQLEFGLPSDPSGWNSWSAMKGRRRQALRLSASVDSLPCAENDFFSSSGSFTYPPEYEEDGSVNNILDAYGERITTTSGSTTSGHRLSGAVSWSVLDHPPIPTLPTPSSKTKGDESSGVGTDTLSSISPTGSATRNVSPSNRHHHLTNMELTTKVTSMMTSGGGEDYEHVYCQLDPYFSPPLLSLTKSQPIVSVGNTRFSPPRASLRSWGRSPSNSTTAGTMDREGVIPFLQQALAIRYREMLDTYLDGPPWYRQHMGQADLDEICPVLYQIFPPTSTADKVYGQSPPTWKKKQQHCSGDHSIHSTYQPILPHHIFAVSADDDSSRAGWLEGDPGSGKTLLCLKFVQEWISFISYHYTNTPLNSVMGAFSLVLYVPLREVKVSLVRFINTELITKKSVLSRLKGGNLYKFLEKATNIHFLIIFDGLEELGETSVRTEVQDVMNGLTFPGATVLLTSRTQMGSDDKRRFIVNGMEWTQIQSAVRRFFTGRKFGGESRLIEILTQRHDLALLASNPFMALLLCLVFEDVGDIPHGDAEFYTTLLKSLVAQNGLSKSDLSPTKVTVPVKWQRAFEDLGKLALSKLGERRTHFTEAEVMETCGSLEILKTGILSRIPVFFGKSNKKSNTGGSVGLLHPSLNLFLAGNYLATRINYPNILRREIGLLPGIGELMDVTVQPTNLAYSVLRLGMEILQKRASALLNFLSLLDSSVNYLLAFLRSSGFYETNLSSICSILRSMKHATIHVNSEWASEWKQVMANPNCPFESVEILIRPGCSLSRLVEGLCLNESINSVKFSSVPGQDWSHVEVNLVSGQLLRLLSEKKLKCLEISMTCLEDKEHLRFQGIIDVLCFILSRNVPLMKLVLDMDLTSTQIDQLVSYIKDHESLDILHLPHLGCGPAGFRSIANVLYEKSFLSLSLTGSWRSTHTDEELGVIVEPLPPMSPFNLKQGPSSLPRAVKSPSIRRKRFPGSLLQESDKRNSDSVLFQRNFLPVPICYKENHEVDGFHGIFSALRDPRNYFNLRSLNLSKCVMNWEDVICLGETIRKTKCLDSLRMEGMKLCDVLPILLGLQENVSLKLLDLSSPHVVIGDDALQLVSTSLSKNQTLRLLSIQGWTCYVEEERSLETLENVLRLSKLQDLDVSGVRIHVNSTSSSRSKLPNTDTLNSNSSKKDLTFDRSLTRPSKSTGLGSILSLSSPSRVTSTLPRLPLPPSLGFLRLGGLTVELTKTKTWKSFDILGRLGENFKLTHLDISLDKNDTTVWTDEKILVKTMKSLQQITPNLKTLVMQNWKVKLTLEKVTIKEISKALQSCQALSEVNLDNTILISTETNRRLDAQYALAFLTNFKSLTEFSWANYDSTQVSTLTQAFDGVKSSNLTIRLDGLPLRVLKNFLLAKFNGTITYVGNHSVQLLRTRDRTDTFMNKLKRLI